MSAQHIDDVSQTLGRIEAKCDSLISQTRVLFEKVDDIQNNGCIAGRQVCTSSRTSAVVWGSGAAAGIAALVEAIRQIFK